MSGRPAGGLVVVLVAALLSGTAGAGQQGETVRRVGPSNDHALASVLISQEAFADAGSADGAVVAREDVFADALAGAALAGTTRPILYTTGGPDAVLRLEVLEEIRRAVGPARGCDAAPDGEVFILGGNQAVSDTVEATIAADGYCTVRFAGATRVETSVLISEAVLARAGIGPGGDVARLLVSRDDTWADAATGGAYAAYAGVPMVVNPTASLHPAVAGLLADYQVQTATFLGGTAALSAEVEAAFAERVAVVERRSGAARDLTATDIATNLWPTDAVRGAMIVNGYADDAYVWAIAGGVLAAINGMPQLYTQADRLPSATEQWLRDRAQGFRLASAGDAVIFVCGSQQRVEEAVIGQLDDILLGIGMRLGYVLPQTGGLAFLGPAQIAGVELAVAEANEAGGVLGLPVQLTGGDSGTDGSVANQTVDRLLGEGVHAIVGAAGSLVSLAIIDEITGAGVLQCSASNTLPTFTGYPDGGYYFRTVPSDALQGIVLAERMVADGATRVGILARADDYGLGIAGAAEAALTQAGATIAASVAYDPDAVTFDAHVEEVAAAGVDAVVLVSFDEGAEILAAMIERGIGPADVIVYGTDVLRSNELAERVDPDDPSVLEGMKGTAPEPTADPAYLERLRAFAPELEETIFSAQAFDCATVIMLAAEQANSTHPTAIRDNILSVAADGTACPTFAACRDLIAADENIDYEGASGPVDLTDIGEPDQGRYVIWRISPDGTVETVDVVDYRP